MKVLGIGFKSAVLNLYYQRFFWDKMVLKKITIDNSVGYVQKSEKTKEKDIKQKIKAGSLPRRQNKNISQNNKNFFKKTSASGFKYLKLIMTYYF